MDNTSIVEVYSARDETQAHAIVRLLEEYDIEARIVGENLRNGIGELPMGWRVEPKIWVHEADALRAREIIEAWEAESRQPSDDSQPSWQCPECDSWVPGNFDVCWQCSHARAVSETETE